MDSVPVQEYLMFFSMELRTWKTTSLARTHDIKLQIEFEMAEKKTCWRVTKTWKLELHGAN